MLYPRNIRDSNLVDWTLLKGMCFVTVWNTVEGRRAKRTAWNWGARLNFALHVTYSCWSVNIECWAGHWSCNYCSCEPHVQKSFSRNILDMGQMADCYLILFIDICCWRWRHLFWPSFPDSRHWCFGRTSTRCDRFSVRSLDKIA